MWNLREDEVSTLQCDLGNCLRTCFMVEMHNWIQALPKAQQTYAIESMFYQNKFHSLYKIFISHLKMEIMMLSCLGCAMNTHLRE